jgi:hypothetical protein
MPVKTAGYAVMNAGEQLVPWTFEHGDVGDDDVHMEVSKRWSRKIETNLDGSTDD